jgi:HD superfamily phosphohydrolase
VPDRSPRSDAWAELAHSFLAANPDYQLREPDGTVPVGGECPAPIGSGGASVVFLTLYKNQLRRAVKLLSPKSELLQNQIASTFLDSFQNEQSMLSELNHENLALLVDFGGYEPGAPGVPFVATQFIDGVTIQSFLHRDDLRWPTVFRLLEQTLAGIAHLHGNRVMHCDIKPDNIRVRQTGGGADFNAVLLDLGGARRIPADLRPGRGGELTYFFSSREYTLPDLRPYLANRSGNRIPWEVLHAAFPRQDLYGFSRILEMIMEAPAVKLPTGVRAALEEMVLRLQSGAYGDVMKVLEALGRLRGTSWSGIDSPDLLTGPAAASRAIRTPIGIVGMEGRIRDFVDHPLFQRLRRVPQLDLLDHVLPGGTHSRFMHSLHMLELARGAISRMASETSISIDLTPELLDRFLFRSLLSNIGHYQLLHVFEDLVEDRKRAPSITALHLLSDEEVYLCAVGARIDEVDRDDAPWNTMTDEHGRTLAALVREHLGEGWVAGQLWSEACDSPIEALLAGLLSSPVDITKMAYLVDDSMMTGLRFGRAVDADEVFAALVRPREEDLAEGIPVVAVRERALSYLENAVLARYWQIQKGYWTKENRALHAMVKYLISSLIEAQSFDFMSYLNGTFHGGSFSALQWLSQRFEQARADDLIPEEARNPVADLLVSRRVIYSRVLTLSPRSPSPARRGDSFIYSELSGKTTLDLNAVAESIRKAITDGLRIPTRPGDILVDLPRRHREESGGRAVVYADDRRENIGDLYQISPVMASMKDSFDLFAKRLRIFIHPQCLREATVEKSLIRARILEYLRENYGPAR